MESFVIALREGVEAALVIGIIVAYLRRTGRSSLIGRVYLGLGIAVIASVAAGFVLPGLFRTIINEEAYEGVLQLMAAALILTLVIWMARAGKTVSRQIEEKMETLSTSPWASWGVMLFAALMIFREGAEVVLLLTVLGPGTDLVVQLLGGLLGITLAVLFGIGFVKGTARIDLGRFFRVTGAVLIVLTVLLVIGGLHEFGEAEIIPVGPREMALIGPVVNSQAYVFSAILIVTAGLVWMGGAPRALAEASNGPVVDEGAAAERKRTWLALVERRWRLGLIVLVALIVPVLTAYQIYTQAPPREEATPVHDVAGEIRIPLADLEDGRMRFFQHELGDSSQRFFALRVSSDRYEVCRDACELCGPIGYYKRGPELVCRNCTAPISLASLGLPGGCNPIPISSEIRDQEIVVSVQVLHNP